MDATKFRYGLEKFRGAAEEALALGHGRIKERVERAYMLISVIRSEENLPAGLRADYDRIQKTLTSKGSIGATMQDMDEDEATTVAERIFRIYMHLERLAVQGGPGASSC